MNDHDTPSIQATNDTALGETAALDLLSAHIKSALIDLENPQRVVSSFFNGVVCELDDVHAELSELLGDAAAQPELLKKLAKLKQDANRSILEFQAFDRVEQRLRHVQQSLHLIADNAQSPQPEQLDLIKSTYSMEHENALHELLESGVSRNQLLDQCSSTVAEACDDDMELF